MSAMSHPALAPFTPAVGAWFAGAFAEPTPAQVQAWPAIAGGKHVLISAPTGSGKTLAAFLWALDRFVAEPPLADPKARRTRLVYISPLKALGYDVEKNLRVPLRGIGADVRVGIRTGDTPQAERRQMLRHPPDILITTPESLYMMLTSQAASVFAGTEWVIVDEIHAVAQSKRGSHLALSLERLAQAAGRDVQRIGLSATQKPLEEVARFLVGPQRECTIVDTGIRKPLDLRIHVPVESMTELGPPQVALDESANTENTRNSIWPAMYPELLRLVREHRSTLIFVNNRRSAERLALRLNELAGEPVARSHHGSLAREERLLVEDQLKNGELPCLVATSSLELGIDMGAVDLVLQVESPKSVTRGLQRIGRAGHGWGDVSKGRIFPKFRADLLESAVVAHRMREGLIETTVVPRNPLDVLAQQIVAMAAVAGDDGLSVNKLFALVRRTWTYADLERRQLENVLDMLDGRYPSDKFAELRARIVWDRIGGTIRARPGARALAIANAGTIPDRGLFTVNLPDGRRVGELDEEMVYEARTGQAFLLGATSWRIEEITRDRVVVTPAPGAPGAVPFWKGDGIGRPSELGQAIGAFSRWAVDQSAETLERDYDLDERAAANLLQYLQEQQKATHIVPSDRAIVVERFRDEIGDWRLCVLSPYGGRVHNAWALAISANVRRRLGVEADPIWSDDGIIIHLPDADEPPAAGLVLVDADEAEELVVAELGNSALFGAHFRENAARALLIPRAYPGRRMPLWQQRLKSQSLLEVARGYAQFPIVLETYRECLRDVLDVPGLQDLLRRIQTRDVSLVEVETATASPFAGALLFDYIATYMYEGDAPNAERRAAALSLDRELLRELLGQEELRELISPEALAQVEADLQRRSERTLAGSADAAHDLLRRLGDLTDAEVRERVTTPDEAEAWLADLEAQRRALRLTVRGQLRWVSAEDAGRFRDALGGEVPAAVGDARPAGDGLPAPAGDGAARPSGDDPAAVPGLSSSVAASHGLPPADDAARPVGLPPQFLEDVPDALERLVRRFAATHGPFEAAELKARYGIDLTPILAGLEREGQLMRGELRPGGAGREWCDPEVLRRLRRASLAALRKEIEPASQRAFARFAPAWQGIDRHLPGGAGVDRLREVLVPLQGVALAPEVWERDVLPRRMGTYSPAWMDELCVAGEVVWIGAGSLGKRTGKVALYFRDDVALLGPPGGVHPVVAERAHQAIRERLGRGPSFYADILLDCMDIPSEELQSALWDLVWAGEVTNDAFAPLRSPRLSAPIAAQRVAAQRAHHGRRFGIRRPGAMAQVQGRWSLTETLFGAAPADPRERRRAQAELLLERYGIVTRELVTAEGVAGGFSALYDALSGLEMVGHARRGYFVEGLGGAQFALPAAVERLRGQRESSAADAPVLLAATDPAQPYGAALRWPHVQSRSPARQAGAYAVLVGGEPIIYVERGGAGLQILAAPADPRVAAALHALVDAVQRGQIRRLALERVDGEPAVASAYAEQLRGLGFRAGPRKLTLTG